MGIVKTFAIIKDNIVVNTVLAEQEYADTQDGWVEFEEGVQIGDIYENEVFTRPPIPKVVPESVTPRQVRLLLLEQNLLADVEAMIAASDEATKITWDYAIEFERNNPLLLQLAANLGLTEDQIDDFFILASKL